MITLQKENYKIDSTNWKEITDQNGVKVKESPEWDVLEYVEWDYKWEQLFTRWAVERLWIKDKLPTYEQMKELAWDDYKQFLKDNNIKFCGWRNPNNKKFYNIDKEFDVWCEDGSNFSGDRDGRCHNHLSNDTYGFSVRCVQGLDSTILLFEKITNRAEDNWAKLGAKAWYDLGEILDSNSIEEWILYKNTDI